VVELAPFVTSGNYNLLAVWNQERGTLGNLAGILNDLIGGSTASALRQAAVAAFGSIAWK
jgi:hypothetical protein